MSKFFFLFFFSRSRSSFLRAFFFLVFLDSLEKNHGGAESERVKKTRLPFFFSFDCNFFVFSFLFFFFLSVFVSSFFFCFYTVDHRQREERKIIIRGSRSMGGSFPSIFRRPSKGESCCSVFCTNRRSPAARTLVNFILGIYYMYIHNIDAEELVKHSIRDRKWLVFIDLRGDTEEFIIKYQMF